jgi:hypothetical protein
MRLFLILPFLACFSCSSPEQKEESDRKNLYQAQFFYEQGFPGKAMEKAKQIKESSPRYDEARDWIDRVEMDNLGPAYQEE